MSISSTHTLHVTFDLPDGVWIGHTMGGKFYIRVQSDESPSRALDLAREAVAAMEEAVEMESLEKP